MNAPLSAARDPAARNPARRGIRRFCRGHQQPRIGPIQLPGRLHRRLAQCPMHQIGTIGQMQILRHTLPIGHVENRHVVTDRHIQRRSK